MLADGSMKHIVSFSGGKDSTLMLILMLEKEMPVDDIIFADTGVEFPETYDYIERVEQYTGRRITRLKSDYTWDMLFFHKKTKGKRIGEINAFPRAAGCNANTYLKKLPIHRYYRCIKDEYTVYIGIAYNEPERYGRLKANEKAPLYEWRIDEDYTIQELKRRGLHNPLYDVFSRQGCFMCPQMGVGGARKLRKHYPALWGKLMWYGQQAEKNAKEKRCAEWREGWTVSELEKRFALEDMQGVLSI